MSERPKLRIVPFDPNDYSLGKVLIKESQTEISNQDSLSAVFSLLFQWIAYAQCAVITEHEDTLIPAAIDFDRDERSPEEFWLTLRTKNIYKVGSKFKIRFEIFRQCYEFSALALADSEYNCTTDVTRLIISVPESIVAYTSRRLPRVIIPSELDPLMSCYVILKGGQRVKVKVIEMGTRSIKVCAESPLQPDISRMILGDKEVGVESVRAENETYIFIFKTLDNKEFGAIFDFYRIAAFPHLRSKYEFHTEQMVNLYLNTNYISKFQTPDLISDRISTFEMVWQEMKKEMHNSTADYVTVSDTGQLVGASSVALGFYNSEKPIWVFHQLCTVASPSLLLQSGELYTWRAEYLASRSEALDAIVWFDSSSRWLERIYVKFAFHKTNQAKLYPIIVSRREFLEKESTHNVQIESMILGKFERIIGNSDTSFGGINPLFLNASGILDAVVCLNSEPNISEISTLASSLLHGSKSSTGRLEVTVPYDAKATMGWSDDEILKDVDRLCYFQKESLVDFIASVEHSIAVTKRKKEQGELGATA